MPILVCPNCGGGMQELDRNAVRIDICTNCRGVWLDRGELEKLLAMRQPEERGEWDEEYEDRRGTKRRKRDFMDFFDFG